MMDSAIQDQQIIDKIKSGMKFGLFVGGSRCYFEDGEQVSYTALWKAIKQVHDLPDGHHKTLAQACPENFIGVFPYDYSKHPWKGDGTSTTQFPFMNFLFKTNWLAYLTRKFSF